MVDLYNMLQYANLHRLRYITLFLASVLKNFQTKNMHTYIITFGYFFNILYSLTHALPSQVKFNVKKIQYTCNCQKTYKV
jgi:hypothetical protein